MTKAQSAATELGFLTNQLKAIRRMADGIVTEKVCTGCRVSKLLSEFPKRKGSPDGHRGQCKACQVQKNAEYCKRWREKYPSRFKAAVKRANEKGAEKKKEWAANNRSRMVEYTRKWRETNPEKIAAYVEASKEHLAIYRKEWKRSNPELVLAQVHRRRSRKIGNGGEHTGEELISLLESQEHRCANPYCRTNLREAKKELDHKVSLASGGTSDIGNLQWLCAPCNRRKHAKPMDEWLAAEERRSRKAA